MAGIALVFPFVYYAENLVVSRGLVAASGLHASSLLPIALVISTSFIAFPFITYMTAYKWINWACIFLPIVNFVTNSIFSLTQSSTPEVISLYRSICIFVSLLNDVMSLIFIFFKFIIIIVTCTGFTIILIHGISLISLIPLVISFLLVLVLNVLMYFAGRIFQKSLTCIQEWKKSAGTLTGVKSLASLRACRIQVSRTVVIIIRRVEGLINKLLSIKGWLSVFCRTRRPTET